MVPDIDGPTHEYMAPAPGCWERYTALEDWKQALTGDDGIATAQDLVDSYAAQHAKNPDPRNLQSVAVHLMSLCSGRERGVSGRERRARLGTWTERNFPELWPRPSEYKVTALDVAAATDADRQAAVERLASTTWMAWASNQATIRSWLDS